MAAITMKDIVKTSLTGPDGICSWAWEANKDLR